MGCVFTWLLEAAEGAEERSLNLLQEQEGHRAQQTPGSNRAVPQGSGAAQAGREEGGTGVCVCVGGLAASLQSQGQAQ